MWLGTCVYETSADRFVAQTMDPSATLAQAQVNRDIFIAGQEGRVISASPLHKDTSRHADPLARPRTTASDTMPWRPDLASDTREVHFQTLALPDGTEGLNDLLFAPDGDQEWPTPLRIEGIDTPAPLETFALIDGALNMTIPDALTGSGLDHVTLFGGKTAVELADVAPWLVRLEPDAPLTRALLNDNAPPIGQWPLQSALFLRSRLGLHGLRRSLRRFIRIENGEGEQPSLFRFYAPSVFRSVVAAMDPEILGQLMAGIDMVAGPNKAHGKVMSKSAFVAHRGQVTL